MVDIESVLASLSLAEKVKLVSGASAWRTHPIESAGIPVLKVSDGPNGVRGDGGVSAVCFPVGICMASTWNPELIADLGRAVGDEARSKDVQVVLGPTINIHRTPLGGRNFECYSEDPYLSGMLAAAFTTGVQEQGVGACLKHYVCNDSEFERHTISTEVDTRTLREIYLRPFELAIRKSRPWTVMASYNRINGVYACSHDELVNGVLKTEWGFDGLVISDWFAAKETVANALGGLDLEMPGGPHIVWGKQLQKAVEDGAVPESVVDDKVRRLLRVIEWSGRFDAPEEQPEQGLNKPEHAAVAYRAAAEGIVLLKNNGVLPFAAASTRKIAVIGPNTRDFRIMGGGSSTLKPHYVSAPLDALQEKLDGVELITAVGCLTHKFVPAPDRHLLSPSLPDSEGEATARGLLCRFHKDGMDSEVTGERVIGAGTIMLGGMGLGTGAHSVVLEGSYQAAEAGIHEFGLLSTGVARLYLDDELLIDNWTHTEPGEAFFTQGTAEKRATKAMRQGERVRIRIEYQVVGDDGNFRAVRYGILPPQPQDPIGEAVQLAASADAVILMVGTNDDWETEGNDREALGLPGEQDELIRQVLRANANTVVVNNSGSPIAMPWLADAPAVVQTWFAGQEFGNALTDILFGTVNPSGKLPISFPKRLQDTPAFTSYPGEFGKVHYGEGVFVGYRWYDSRDIEPLLAFGHGLSYTTFDYSHLEVGGFDGEQGLELACTLANSGDRPGMETVQVYVEPIHSPVARPIRELKAFAKISLAAGESQRVSLVLEPDSFAHWDVSDNRWLIAPGLFKVCVGSSSRDLRLVGEVVIAA